MDTACVKSCKAAAVMESVFGDIDACTIASRYVACLENCANHSSNVTAEQLADAETVEQFCGK